MDVESRDSVSLKPAELDELGQLVSGVGLPLQDEQLDGHVEQFPLVAIAAIDGRAPGVPVRVAGAHRRHAVHPVGPRRACRGAATPGPALDGLVAELYRRAAISFPDEDVLVAGRIAHPAAYTLFARARRRLPRPEVHAQRRGAGLGPTARPPLRLRRPLRRPRVPARAPTARPSWCSTPAAVKAGGKVAAELVGEVDPANGEAMIAYGWAMAEALADGLATPRS